MATDGCGCSADHYGIYSGSDDGSWHSSRTPHHTMQLTTSHSIYCTSMALPTAHTTPRNSTRHGIPPANTPHDHDLLLLALMLTATHTEHHIQTDTQLVASLPLHMLSRQPAAHRASTYDSIHHHCTHSTCHPYSTAHHPHAYTADGMTATYILTATHTHTHAAADSPPWIYICVHHHTCSPY